MISSVVIVALAAALRIVALQDGFWLDEIWSYLYARDVNSLYEVFTRHRIDNNHLLNTLVLWQLGDQLDWRVYRLPVAFCGVATVALAGLWLSRSGKIAGLTGMLFTAISFPLVVYSTEARGYGYAVCFAMLCLVCADRVFPLRVPLYWLGAAMGMLSHLTFIPFLLAVMLWLAIRRTRLQTQIALNAVPLISMTLLYLGFVRSMEVGGGPMLPLAQVLSEALAMTCGVFAAGALRTGTAIAIVLLGTAAALALRRAGNDRWMLYVLGIAVCPLAVVLVRILTSEQYVYLYARYFLIPIALILLLFAEWIGLLAVRTGCARATAIVLAGLLVAGNVASDLRFLRAGRGNYLAAMRFIEASSPPGAITIASDNNYRGRMEVAFYARYLPQERTVSFISEGDLRALPQWMIVHSDDPDVSPETAMGPDVARYELAGSFPHFGPSGWTWHVYRRRN